MCDVVKPETPSKERDGVYDEVWEFDAYMPKCCLCGEYHYGGDCG